MKIVVTGGASGIGKAVVRKLLADGKGNVHVFAYDIMEAGLKDIAPGRAPHVYGGSRRHSAALLLSSTLIFHLLRGEPSFISTQFGLTLCLANRGPKLGDGPA